MEAVIIVQVGCYDNDAKSGRCHDNVSVVQGWH